MSKRKISQQQLKRIKKLQAKQVQEKELQDFECQFRGRVVAHYGKYSEVKCDEDFYHCRLRQNLGAIVVGDEVLIQVNDQKEGVIISVYPRKTKFWRLDDRRQEKLIAANAEQILIVMSPVPEPSWLLLDSYLAAIEILKLSPVIVFNKMDLAHEDYLGYWSVYQKLQIPILKTSVEKHKGIEELAQLMENKVNIFVGQSGVGKSSLIQALLPEESLTVGEVHAQTGLGTHTTSTSRMYPLATQGWIIDSPGIRDFNLWKMSAAELSQGFVEFQPYLSQCKFRDCSHQHEPGCAIKEAISKGTIALSRWQNYHTLLERFKSGS